MQSENAEDDNEIEKGNVAIGRGPEEEGIVHHAEAQKVFASRRGRGEPNILRTDSSGRPKNLYRNSATEMPNLQ